MGFKQNDWKQKRGYRESDGKIWMPVEGKLVLPESTLKKWLLGEDKYERIVIEGRFEVWIGNECTPSDDLVPEFENWLPFRLPLKNRFLLFLNRP